MEADIASQAVGLGTNTDFSLMNLFLHKYLQYLPQEYLVWLHHE